MNTRRVIIGIALLVGLIILIDTDAVSAMVTFLFLGIVPGTNIVVPSWLMLPLCALVAFLAILWIVRQPSHVSVNSRNDIAERHVARKRVTKRLEKRTTRRIAHHAKA